MTYKRFSSLDRAEALTKLGDVILNNLLVTEKAIEYCGIRRHNYRLSSDIFPLMTYDKAHISFNELPQVDEIFRSMDNIMLTRQFHNVRLSSHPDQFNVLASANSDAVDRTIRELEFQGKFMTWIGCSLDYNSPINIHVNRSAQSDDARKSVRDLFYKNFERLSDNVKKRLVLENDDKTAGWTVAELFDYFDRPEIPITFDYLHHKCHHNDTPEKEAFLMAVQSWQGYTPLFHYSESIPGDKNPRKHADYAQALPDTYDRKIDLDFEFKMKEKSFSLK
jgi:UV DNA damage endonuclease